MSAITSRFAPAANVPWRLIAVAAALLLALAVGLALLASGRGRHPAPPFGPAVNGQVFYSSAGDIYATDLATNQSRPIVTGGVADSDPVLTPDGTRLSFLRHASGSFVQTWVVNVDGSELHRLATPDREPAWFEWSPAGDVAVTTTDSDPTAMTLVPADGSAATRVDLGVTIGDIVFRPATGSQLAFIGTDRAGDRGIYLVNRDGSGVRRLDLDPGFNSDPGYASNRDAYFWTFAVSPTGDRLLYSQLEPTSPEADGPSFRIHVASIDAAGNVTSDRMLEFNAATDDEFAPAWLPSGEGLVFQNVEGMQHWLSTATLDGSRAGPARRLDVSANDWIGAQVSPDGTKVLAVMPAGSTLPVVLADLASGTVAPVSFGTDANWQRLGR